MPRTPDPEVGGSSPTQVKPCCVHEQGTFTPQKVLVIPRKRWLRPNMTEKLFTGMLRINHPTNQPCNVSDFIIYVSVLIMLYSDFTMLLFILHYVMFKEIPMLCFILHYVMFQTPPCYVSDITVLNYRIYNVYCRFHNVMLQS